MKLMHHVQFHRRQDCHHWGGPDHHNPNPPQMTLFVVKSSLSSEERTRNNHIQKEEDAQKHSPAETAVTDRLLRPRQRPRHYEEKGTEVPWLGKKRRSI